MKSTISKIWFIDGYELLFINKNNYYILLEPYTMNGIIVESNSIANLITGFRYEKTKEILFKNINYN